MPRVNRALVYPKEIREQIKQLYSQTAIEKRLKIHNLYNTLLQCTPNGQVAELTNVPLVRRPPPGFQKCHIEFALRKVSKEQVQHFRAKSEKFLSYLKDNNRLDQLLHSLRMCDETYHLMKGNGDPQQNMNLFLNGEKSYFQELFEQKWKVIRIYSDEKPAGEKIVKVPRAYIMISNPLRNKKRKIIIAFMGAEVYPRLPESWWTNDKTEQHEIWKINFDRTSNSHSGLKEYGRTFVSNIVSALKKNLSALELSQADFELTGHSTGGVLAIITAQYLRETYTNSDIHALLFATPAFMNLQEGLALQSHFPNDEHHAIFNIISLTDPAISIYGENLFQPEHHTIYSVPPNFSGESFLNVHAASVGTTTSNIKNHGMKNYRGVVNQLLGMNSSKL